MCAGLWCVGLGEHKTNRTAYSDYSHLFEQSQEYGISSGGDISIPFYISTAGFGLLYNQAGYGFIHINPTQATWGSNATHQLDLWVTTSPAKSTQVTPFPSISSNYADATGHPNPIPHFASGFWQSKDRSHTQQQQTTTLPIGTSAGHMGHLISTSRSQPCRPSHPLSVALSGLVCV